MKGKNLLFVVVLCLAVLGVVASSDSASHDETERAAKGASATSSLTQRQAGLYLICVTAITPVSLPAGALAVPTSLISQYRQLTQLSGLNPYTLGSLESSVLAAYAKTNFPLEKPHKGEGDALKQFSAFTESQCLSTASGFTG